MNKSVVEYDRAAPTYDESRFTSKLGRHLDYMHKKIVNGMLRSSEKLVLEVGVGTGRFALWLVEKGHEVIGVDISRSMLEQAKTKADMVDSNLSLILSDLHFLPFRKGVFDACICINVIDHISRFDGFIREVKYVDKQGPFIFNISNLKSPYFPIAAMINFRNKAFFKQDGISSRWLTLDEVTGLLLRNSFAIEETKGCMIASALPLGDKLVKLVERINSSTESSRLRSLSGSIFIKARPRYKRTEE